MEAMSIAPGSAGQLKLETEKNSKLNFSCENSDVRQVISVDGARVHCHHQLGGLYVTPVWFSWCLHTVSDVTAQGPDNN